MNRTCRWLGLLLLWSGEICAFVPNAALVGTQSRRVCYKANRAEHGKTRSHRIPQKAISQPWCREKVTRFGTRTAKICASVMVGLLVKSRASWAAERALKSTVSVSTISMPVIHPTQLFLAASLVFYTGIVAPQLQGNFLKPLVSSLAKACGRCALQLYIAGGLILTPLFQTTKPWVVAAWLGFTALLAAREASSRLEYSYPNLKKHLLISLVSAISLVLAATMGLGILSPTPWYSPRTWIPVVGMLMGNAMTATALAAGALTGQIATGQAQLELQLARGATWREALSGVLQKTYATALTPTINALSVTGVVSIPGMMTGQLLAGQTPFQAAAYQVLIFFLITATACTSVQILTQLTTRALVDPHAERLRICDKTGQALLKPVAKDDKETKLSWSSLKAPYEDWKRWKRARWKRTRERKQSRQQKRLSFKDDATLVEEEMKLGMIDGVPVGGAQAVRKQKNSMFFTVSDDDRDALFKKKDPIPTYVYYRQNPSRRRATNTTMSSTMSDQEDGIVLKIDEMAVDRTSVSLSLNVKSGDIIGIQGPSGVGKSQVLRTIAGLECVDRNSVSIHGCPARDMTMAEWRQKVALVPQERPSLEETPRQFYEHVRSFQSQKYAEWTLKENEEPIFLSSLLSEWGLADRILDQPWATLSGGEAQRVSLAIALALRPTVLLLDECTSALDEKTSLLVEETLMTCGIPIVMVSHDTDQIKRLGNQIIELVPAGPF